jgi:hypothetical protein
LGIRPYTRMLKQWRAEKLSDKFPNYDSDIIHLFSASDPMMK